MPKNFSPPPPYREHDVKVSTITEHAIKNISNETKENNRVKNAQRNGKLNTSDAGTLVHLVKSSLGSGFLAVPYAFSNSGLLLGVIGIAFIAFITAHCTHILVKCSQELCHMSGRSFMGYTDTVEYAFLYGSGGRFRRWSRLMRYVAVFFMFVTYYGVNTIYVILIADSVKEVLENHVDFTMNIRLYALAMFLVIFPVGIVRHMKFLVPFSALANVCLLVGCGLTVYICCLDLPSLSSRPLVVEVSKWSLFFSTALFGMEGIGTVMPVENAMRHPAHFLGCPGVLNFAMVIIALANLVVGSIGYIKYGDAVEGSITLNLPQDTLSESVKIMVATAILFTYPLQLTASMEVVWDGVKDKFSEKMQTFGYYLVRAFMITGTVAIAVAVPDLSPVISLIGAIGFSGLGLLLPTVTELVTYWDTLSKPCGLTVVKAVVLLVIWAFATVAGTISSVQDIIADY